MQTALPWHWFLVNNVNKNHKAFQNNIVLEIFCVKVTGLYQTQTRLCSRRHKTLARVWHSVANTAIHSPLMQEHQHLCLCRFLRKRGHMITALLLHPLIFRLMTSRPSRHLLATWQSQGPAMSRISRRHTHSPQSQRVRYMVTKHSPSTMALAGKYT